MTTTEAARRLPADVAPDDLLALARRGLVRVAKRGARYDWTPAAVAAARRLLGAHSAYDRWPRPVAQGGTR